MARTTEEWLVLIQAVVPEWMLDYEAHLAGMAAMLAEADSFHDEAVDATTIAEGAGAWLALHARGLGITKGPDEADSDLRTRMRDVEDAVTPPAILAAVNAILADYTAEEAELVEHWDAGFFVGHDFLGHGRIRDEYRAFTLVLPDLGVSPEPLGHFLLDGARATDPSAAFLDRETYLTDAAISTEAAAVYAAIIATVERLRGHGVRWWAVLAD